MKKWHHHLTTVLIIWLLGAFGWAAAATLQVQVEPEDAALKANIEGYIGDLEDRDARSLRNFRRVAVDRTRQAAEALGYYQANIRVRVRRGDTPTLAIHVDAGERVRLRTVDIRVEGPASELVSFRMPAGSQLEPGAPLSHANYEEAKRLIQNQAARYGFFDGRFVTQRLDIEPDAGAADIHLLFQSGERYRMGDIRFAGDYPFGEPLLRRMLPFQPDTPYDSELIAQLYQNMQGSGYFDTVRVDALPATAEAERIPVVVNLQARKPRTMGLGLGYSTDVGPRGRANWTRHWRNPEGHSYGFEMELSQPRQNVGLWYDIPGNPPMTDKWRFAGGYQKEELASDDSLSKLLTIGPEWHSQRPNGWQRVLSVKAMHEEYRLGDDSGTSTLLMPGISYSILRSDHRMDPSKGYRVQFDLSGAVDGVGSDADVIHGNVLLRGLTTVFHRHRFLGRAQVGVTETNSFSGVPPSLRFFAGGDQSVRGYSYQTLSPENNRGDRIGGRYMVAASAEYQYSLTEKWRLATFIDQGNAFNSLTSPSLKTGVGVGIRWVSPVGPLRLDLAHAVDDGGFRIHFSMGPEL